MERLPNVLISIHGIGPVYSAGIMAEIGDINRFTNQAQLVKYASPAWTQRQSGNFEAQNTRLIRSGNRFLKYYLCEAAFSLVRCDKALRRVCSNLHLHLSNNHAFRMSLNSYVYLPLSIKQAQLSNQHSPRVTQKLPSFQTKKET